MKIINKTYKELMDLKRRKQGWYYSWLITFSSWVDPEGFTVREYTQKSLKTSKIVARGYVIYES